MKVAHDLLLVELHPEDMAQQIQQGGVVGQAIETHAGVMARQRS